ncbi:ribulose 1,5-bisphosphate carboxylase [Paracoccus sp. S-4012]|uniref:ribulose-bisphosphate carboxylase large subunit family protein n=1 Tax=Paracoccus sp. S-4012 TaxID=2665648 RepID=UPI0012AFE4C2|nr:ribulose-bisphosphate carboxylase large subunit family protein [Paracoccus sp. S-4012]MRX52081.1 ribulose 1,5-bisphosphate carboxylase [Paracoccus sp. S-4012]
MTQRIEADYLIETPRDPARAAEDIAGEQSSGTFVAVPGEDAPGVIAARARVERLELLDQSDTPALPGARGPGPFRRAAVTISWPLDTIGPSLPNLVATVAGNLFELAALSGIRLLDLRLPPAFGHRYPGPRFGVAGTRRLSGVATGPLIGTIIKPSVGLSPEETAALTRRLCEAGIDFIKDDELQSDGPACPFEARARAVLVEIDRHRQRTGRNVLFALNITGEIDEMRRRHDFVVELGGNCAMASVNSVGLAGMVELGRHSLLPIHAHRNGWGAMTRAPMLGWSFPAWSKLWRLAGADHLHVNGIRNKFTEDDESVVASARSLLTPLWTERPCVTMPVFSSGQTVFEAHDTYAAIGTDDLIHAAGGGILAHPQGPKAGVEAMRAAWTAAAAGEPLDEAAAAFPPLAAAVEAYAR